MINWAKNIFKKNNTFERLMLFLDNYAGPQRKVNYLHEGYIQNVIVRRCIDEVASNCAFIPLKIYGLDKKEVIENHKLMEKLRQPNLYQSLDDFTQMAITNYLYSGDLFILKTLNGKQLLELFVLPSKSVTVKKGVNGFPIGYTVISAGGESKDYLINNLTGECDIMHMHNVNPLDPFIGLPILASAESCVQIINQGLYFNATLIKNGARPSGLLKTKNILGPEQRNEFKEFASKLSGAENAGKLPILEGDTDYVELGLKPTEMGFESLLNMASRYIGSLFGVPFALIIPDAATYENLRTARELMAQNTVIPLMSKFCANLTQFLKGQSEKPFVIDFSEDDVQALEGVRERKFDRMANVTKSGLLKINEAREKLGFEPVEGGDVLLVPSSQIPIEMTGIGLTPEPDQSIKSLLKQAGYSGAELEAEYRSLGC